MIDGIIKGDGTSRRIRSVSNIKELYPTYESFLEALAAGTVPVDILFYEEGWSQIPDFLNKANLFADDTATLYGDGIRVPNDAFKLLTGLMPTGKGILSIYTTNSDGDPVSMPIEIETTLGGRKTELYYTSENGQIFVPVEPQTCTVRIDSDFYVASKSEYSVTVETGTFKKVTIAAELKATGNKIITVSSKVAIPKQITLLDIFVAGAGGSGAAGSGEKTCVTGGAGGKTKTLLKQNLAGKILDISVGAGGKAVSATIDSENVSGLSGGKTSISVSGVVLLEADGGNGGNVRTSTSSITSASGGSDSGLVNSGTATNGGTNGIPGQGSTTKAFGESSGELYCSGAGAAYGYKESSVQGSFDKQSTSNGGTGSGDGIIVSSEIATGRDATSKGSGGGPILTSIRVNAASSSMKVTSGNGADGIARIRW